MKVAWKFFPYYIRKTIFWKASETKADFSPPPPLVYQYQHYPGLLLLQRHQWNTLLLCAALQQIAFKKFPSINWRILIKQNPEDISLKINVNAINNCSLNYSVPFDKEFSLISSFLIKTKHTSFIIRHVWCQGNGYSALHKKWGMAKSLTGTHLNNVRNRKENNLTWHWTP